MFLGLIRCGDLGGRRIIKKAIGVDLSFQAALYENRTVSGNRNPTVDGTYSTTLYNGGVSIRMVY